MHLLPMITPETLGLIGYTAELIEKNEGYKNRILSLLKYADIDDIYDIQIKEHEIDKNLLKYLAERPWAASSTTYILCFFAISIITFMLHAAPA